MIKYEIHKGHHNRNTTPNPNTTINYINIVDATQKKETCVDISRKKVSPLEKLSHIAVCLRFQPERKLNWKTLREKRQRLEDLSDLEQKS